MKLTAKKEPARITILGSSGRFTTRISFFEGQTPKEIEVYNYIGERVVCVPYEHIGILVDDLLHIKDSIREHTSES